MTIRLTKETLFTEIFNKLDYQQPNFELTPYNIEEWVEDRENAFFTVADDLREQFLDQGLDKKAKKLDLAVRSKRFKHTLFVY